MNKNKRPDDKGYKKIMPRPDDMGYFVFKCKECDEAWATPKYELKTCLCGAEVYEATKEYGIFFEGYQKLYHLAKELQTQIKEEWKKDEMDCDFLLELKLMTKEIISKIGAEDKKVNNNAKI